MNLVELSGNLVRDPKLRYSQNDKAYCKFIIAVNEGYGDRQRVDFFPITVFGKQGENCNEYLRQGSKVLVVGRLESGSYKNENGDDVYTTDVIAKQVEFVGRRIVDEPDDEKIEDEFDSIR